MGSIPSRSILSRGNPMIDTCCVSAILASTSIPIRPHNYCSGSLEKWSGMSLSDVNHKRQGKSASYDRLYFKRPWTLKAQGHKEVNNTMLCRGTVVTVRAFGGKLLRPRVWEDLGKSILICKESEYRRAVSETPRHLMLALRHFR